MLQNQTCFLKEWLFLAASGKLANRTLWRAYPKGLSTKVVFSILWHTENVPTAYICVYSERVTFQFLSWHHTKLGFVLVWSSLKWRCQKPIWALAKSLCAAQTQLSEAVHVFVSLHIKRSIFRGIKEIALHKQIHCLNISYLRKRSVQDWHRTASKGAFSAFAYLTTAHWYQDYIWLHSCVCLPDITDTLLKKESIKVDFLKVWFDFITIVN